MEEEGQKFDTVDAEREVGSVSTELPSSPRGGPGLQRESCAPPTTILMGPTVSLKQLRPLMSAPFIQVSFSSLSEPARESRVKLIPV